MFNKRCNCDRQMWNPGFNQPMNMPQMSSPVMEPTITKCIEKDFYHQIPHVCPIHTHTINRHILTHCYTPQYTCSEECQVIDCGRPDGCCGF
ncbi:MAG: hypothetical protein PHO63_04175 [Bacilli bacterium]|nr:hypothetical protein [Bacilli bacterium]MDD4808716.1 hypothetical protein [Bacilli bacterium]